MYVYAESTFLHVFRLCSGRPGAPNAGEWSPQKPSSCGGKTAPSVNPASTASAQTLGDGSRQPGRHPYPLGAWGDVPRTSGYPPRSITTGTLHSQRRLRRGGHRSRRCRSCGGVESRAGSERAVLHGEARASGCVRGAAAVSVHLSTGQAWPGARADPAGRSSRLQQPCQAPAVDSVAVPVGYS